MLYCVYNHTAITLSRNRNTFSLFTHIQMKGNTDKCHVIMSTNNVSEIQVGESLESKQIIVKNVLVLNLITI